MAITSQKMARFQSSLLRKVASDPQLYVMRKEAGVLDKVLRRAVKSLILPLRYDALNAKITRNALAGKALTEASKDRVANISREIAGALANRKLMKETAKATTGIVATGSLFPLVDHLAAKRDAAKAAEKAAEQPAVVPELSPAPEEAPDDTYYLPYHYDSGTMDDYYNRWINRAEIAAFGLGGAGLGGITGSLIGNKYKHTLLGALLGTAGGTAVGLGAKRLLDVYRENNE